MKRAKKIETNDPKDKERGGKEEEIEHITRIGLKLPSEQYMGLNSNDTCFYSVNYRPNSVLLPEKVLVLPQEVISPTTSQWFRFLTTICLLRGIGLPGHCKQSLHSCPMFSTVHTRLTYEQLL